MIPMPLMSVGPAVAALIVHTDRRIVQRLRAAGALSADRAVPQAGSWLVRARLRCLTARGVLTRTADGQYALDEAGWAAWRRLRRIRALIGMSVGVGVALILYAAFN